MLPLWPCSSTSCGGGLQTVRRSEGSPGWNVRIHLFARAQNQYLFPASIEHPDKNVPSDAGLVKWWKAVMDDFVSACTKDEENSSGGQLRVEPHVILPGATDDEVMHSLRVPLQKPEATMGYDWRYGHPIHQSSTSFPAWFPLFSSCSLPPFWNSSRTYRTTRNHNLLAR